MIGPFLRLIVLICLFLGLRRLNWAACASSASASASALSKPTPNNRNNNNKKLASTSSSSNSTTRVIQLLETEVYDGSTWKASPQQRWTKIDHDDDSPSNLSPDQLQRDWIGEWKIVTSNHRDEFGWEYSLGQNKMATRQRIWLRTCRVYPQLQQRRSSLVRLALHHLREEWNFKGLGWTFYKSVVFPRSFGIMLRLPLTYNLNLWETHPSWPSVSVSLAYYHPNPQIVLFWNASLRMEWIQWLLTNAVNSILYATAWLLWTLVLRGLVLAGSAILYPITKQLIHPPIPVEKPEWNRPPQYSRTVEERLGYSASWRVSMEQGYEFRHSIWHYYAPTVASLWLQLQKRTIRNRIPSWIVRRVAAVGLSTSGLIPDEPYVTASALLSLSGYYFRRRPPLTAAAVPPITMVSMSHDDNDEDDNAAPNMDLLNANTTTATNLLAVATKSKPKVVR